jgi:predicted transcriptional regulator
MDTQTYSAAEAARRLETNIPRVVRHVEKLGFRARTPSGRLCLTPQMLSRLEDEMGYTPKAPGLSMPQVRALTALREAPFGLASARAVARRAGLSPTAASRALKTLEEKGLIYREQTMIAAGRARPATVYHANPLAEGWNEIEPFLRKTRLKESACRPDETVPYRLRHLFWNAAPEQLIVADAGPYIARRILTRFDLDGLSWGARNLKASDWRRAAEARGLDERTRALALNIAEESDGQG